MAGYTLTGKVTKVYKTQQVTESFKKREIVVMDDSNPQYPEYAVFQFTQDKCSLLDAFAPGDTVTVHFNIKGRPYQKPMEETKYFSNLQGWKIEGTGSNKGGTEFQQTGLTDISSPPEEDDLPF